MATRSQNPLGLPPKAERQWTHVYQSALDRGLSKQGAAAQATCAVKRGYYKKGGRWVKRKKALGKDKQPPGCRPSKSVSGKRSKPKKSNPKHNWWAHSGKLALGPFPSASAAKKHLREDRHDRGPFRKESYRFEEGGETYESWTGENFFIVRDDDPTHVRISKHANPRGKAGPKWEPSSSVGEATRTQSEAADFAIRRWHELAPWQERDLTWAEFGRRIRATGDPGSRETAKVIETIPGYVKDWALTAEPVAKIKRRVLR